VSGRDLESGVQIIDLQGDAVHPDLVGEGRPGRDRRGVDVLEQLDASVPVRGAEQRDPGVVAVEPDGCVRPLPADLVGAQEGEAEVGEEGDGGVQVTDGDADVFKSG